MMFWVIKQVLLILAGCFFLAFGVSVLIQSYHLQDPFSFVLTFFASNLMILISAAILLGLVLRLASLHRRRQGGKKDRLSDEDSDDDGAG